MTLLSLADAARKLDMLPSRLARLAKRGGVPHVLLPDGELRFIEGDLDAWIDGYRRGVSFSHGGTDDDHVA